MFVGNGSFYQKEKEIGNGELMAAEDILIDAMLHRQPSVRLERCFSNINEIFRKTFHKERRLLAIFGEYEYTMYASRIPLAKDYELVLKYRENAPDDINDVMVDLKEFDVKKLLAGNYPDTVMIITDDMEVLKKIMNKKMNYIISSFEGLIGWNMEYWQVEMFSADYGVVLSFQYMLSENEMRNKMAKATLAGRKIWRKILGNAKVPDFVKPFLALSYLTQECTYDEAAIKELNKNPHTIPKDPAAHLSYGPLVENRGICGGLAWAFKRLMDIAGIECITVGGYLREDQSIGHAWDLVKLDGQYYHVDPTSGIKNDGVFVTELLQTDNIYKATHIWNINDYPAAKGVKYDYEMIEDFLVENGNEYLDNGADEKYMFPDKIVD